MARLNKKDKYAILWLSSQGLDTTAIVNELNIPEETVKNCLEKFKSINEDNNVKTTSSVVGEVKNKNLIVHQTAGKKNKGVSIMTPEASMVNDAAKKTFQPKTHRDKSAIYNPIKK